jgi:hypothetical protein
MLKILLQTTIPYAADDWNVTRFSRLRDELAGLPDSDGSPAAAVRARDREPNAGGVDPVLATLDESDYDQLWLIGVDTGGATGIGPDECAAIMRFRKRGGAIFSTRDHQDLGSSICALGGIGRAHYFHSTNRDPDPARNQRDDPFTTSIDYPNYHSGSNGNVQRVRPEGTPHEVLRDVALLPAHPHEGSVGAPADDPTARVVVTGTSEVTGRPFNIAAAGAAGRNRPSTTSPTTTGTFGPAVRRSSASHPRARSSTTRRCLTMRNGTFATSRAGSAARRDEPRPQTAALTLCAARTGVACARRRVRRGVAGRSELSSRGQR